MFTSGRIIELVRKSFRLQLVRELSELVEIDTRPESERMRNRLRQRWAAGLGSLAQTSTDRAIDRFLERDAKLLRAPF